MKLSWKLANGSICNYTLLLKELLDNFHTPDISCGSTVSISEYDKSLVNALTTAATMTIPVVKFRKHVKPYWTSDVKLAHSEMLFKRQIWLNENKPRGASFISYTDFKAANLLFRKTLESAYESFISGQLKEIDECGHTNQELCWTLINRRRINGCNMQHEIEYQGKIYRGSEDIADAWALHFEKLFSNSEHNDFDEQFKKSNEKKVKDIFRKSVHKDDEHLKEPITNDEISLLCSRLKCGKAGCSDNIT
jgi:hypothetical protein